MSYRCDMCDKKTGIGLKRSHSNRGTKRTYKPNLFEKKLFDPETKKFFLAKICAKCLKTYAKVV